MKVLIISGSQRPQSNSIAVAKLIQSTLLQQHTHVSSKVIELAHYSALLTHYGCEQAQANELAEQKAYLLDQLYSCDAVIFVAPEWGGMIPPALSNLLLLTANGSANGLPLGHKPAFAIGISTSGGGANPVAQLKAYAAKNSHLAWCPLHAIIHNVEQFLTAKWQPKSDDRFSQIQSRLEVGISSLLIYAKQLQPVREQLVALSKVHPFGQ